MKRMLVNFVRSSWNPKVRRQMWRDGEMQVCLIVSFLCGIILLPALVSSMLA